MPVATAFLVAGIIGAAASSAEAQISLGVNTGALPNPVCIGGANSTTLIVDNNDNCDDSPTGTVAAPFLQIGPSSSYTFFDAADGSAEFNAPATFLDPVTMNNTLNVSSTATFTGIFSVQGSSATFATPTFFTFPSTFQSTAAFNGATTFNGTANFSAGVTTVNISNSQGIISNTLHATAGLTVSAGANVNMGGNIVQGVAAGVADTDAVNVGQLNAATAGISADITQLETITATHTTQITAIEAVNTTQATQITAIEAVNTTQSSQISALQATQDLFEGHLDTLFDLRSHDRRDMKQGVASAMAMASAPMPSEPGRIAYAVNGATFRGEYAVGGSLTYRLPTQAPVAVNVGFSYAGNKNNGVRVGVAGEF